jgi:DNA-binding CsgD family transcriptional regulator
VEFIVAAADPGHRQALRDALAASGLESGSEIESAEQLQRLLAGRLDAADRTAHEVLVVVAEGVTERAQFVWPALEGGVPVLIWPLRNVPDSLERKGGGSERPASRDAARLTGREREVLALVAAGVSNKGIARALGVSPNTVKFHLSALFDKLQVGTRAEAIAAAARAGQIAL